MKAFRAASCRLSRGPSPMASRPRLRVPRRHLLARTLRARRLRPARDRLPGSRQQLAPPASPSPVARAARADGKLRPARIVNCSIASATERVHRFCCGPGTRTRPDRHRTTPPGPSSTPAAFLPTHQPGTGTTSRARPRGRAGSESHDATGIPREWRQSPQTARQRPCRARYLCFRKIVKCLDSTRGADRATRGRNPAEPRDRSHRSTRLKNTSESIQRSSAHRPSAGAMRRLAARGVRLTSRCATPSASASLVA